MHTQKIYIRKPIRGLLYACMYVCMHACMHIHTHTRTHIYIYIYILVCTLAYVHLTCCREESWWKLVSLKSTSSSLDEWMWCMFTCTTNVALVTTSFSYFLRYLKHSTLMSIRREKGVVNKPIFVIAISNVNQNKEAQIVKVKTFATSKAVWKHRPYIFWINV